MDDTPNFKSRIRQFFTAHPWFGFICFLGAVASIIGLVFSVFPWLAASRKDLSFCINPVRTPIVQIAKQSDVSVSYRGIPVIGNVTAVQIAIWNAGRERIKGDDVLRPIILHMATNQIMEASILKTTRDVSEFQLVSNSIVSNSIGMKWRILEKNDGALLQIVYSGGMDVPLELDGVLVGQPSPDQVTGSKRPNLFYTIVSLLVGPGMILLVLLSKKQRQTQNKLVKCVDAATIILACYYLFQGFILFSEYRTPFTPFGF
jgi:hypothetical protein